MTLPLFHPEREVPVSQVCAGDRLWHNGQFVEVTSADRAGADIRLVCRVPNAPFDQLDFRDPTETVTIEALPHAHRYWQEGPLTIEVIERLIGLEGTIIQSNAGVYLAPVDARRIEGEWIYGEKPELMAYYDPTFTRDQAKTLIEPFLGRPIRITTLSGGLLIIVITDDEVALCRELVSRHPHVVIGGDDNRRWIRISSLTRPQG
ncbi:MAG: hypothetical protein RI947_529 [Candidatus Parcubacteria bacterium]|jgi:hypothetical protein